MSIPAGLTIQRLDVRHLSDDDVRATHRFVVQREQETHPEDPTTPLDDFRRSLANIPSFVDPRVWVARDGDGEVVGRAQGTLMDVDHNRHLLQSGVSVLPAWRRRGLGTHLLAYLVELAAAHERTTLLGMTSDRVPSGEVFCERIGAEAGLRTHTNRLDLTTLDRALVDRWAAEAPGRATDYEVVDSPVPCPEDQLEAIVHLHNVMNDAPRDSLDMEDQTLTPAELREMEQASEATGNEGWRLVARHIPTGELAGFTDVWWHPSQPETVWQGNTGVWPRHRGHGLGKWLKAAMLQRILADRPQARDVRTGNADSNGPMLAINHELGFAPYVAEIAWQIKREKLEAYLAEKGVTVAPASGPSADGG